MLASFHFDLSFCISNVLPLFIHHHISPSRLALRCQGFYVCWQNILARTICPGAFQFGIFFNIFFRFSCEICNHACLFFPVIYFITSAPNICPKCFCFLCIRYYNLVSLFTSIYLLIKSTFIISEKPVLLELTHPLLLSVDLSSFRINSLQYLLFQFWFSFLFQFVPLLQITLVFFIHLLPFNKAFSFPKSLLSPLTWLSRNLLAFCSILFKFSSHQCSS